MDIFSTSLPEASEVSTSRIISHLSRNLRASLNTILGFSDMLIEEEFDTDKKEKIVSIKRSAIGLLDNMKDLLDFSYLHDAMTTTHSFYFSLKTLFENTETQLKEANSGIRLSIRVNPGVPPVVLGDAYMLEKIMLNNLTDISKFMQNRDIVVDVSYRLGLLVVQILAEDLCMIASLQELLTADKNQYQTNIFASYDEQFARLIIGKGLTAVMNGRQYMDIERKLIILEIPLEAQEMVHAEHMHNAWLNKLDVNRSELICAQKIAIIDGDRSSRRILSWLLLSMNYFPMVLKNDENIVENIVENQIDLVILELYMEGFDGFTVNHMLKHDKRTSNLPVLICSMDEDIETMLDYGVFDCIKKPILREEFQAKVNVALSQSGEIRNIMIIDPDKQFLSICKYHLHWENYNVIVYTSREEALQSMEEGLQVNLLVVDKELALAAGGKLLDAFRKYVENESLPVIAMNYPGAYAPPDSRVNLFLPKDHEGCVQLIAKVNGYFHQGLILNEAARPSASLKMDANNEMDNAILSALQGVQQSSWLIDEAIKGNS